LPTEAEWEYAAKGGSLSSDGYKYAGSNTVDEVAWYSSNSSSKTHEVGKKAANGLGLYDMSGNVCEWCWDWWHGSGGYTGAGTQDPVGAPSGVYRIFRGGSCLDSDQFARSAFRADTTPRNRNAILGFRLVRSWPDADSSSR
jgi:formylglycine-generating enzyme required for sulfatase activity